MGEEAAKFCGRNPYYLTLEQRLLGLVEIQAEMGTSWVHRADTHAVVRARHLKTGCLVELVRGPGFGVANPVRERG